MNILIVKLSSLGDVVHAMPAVQDIRQALPEARIDWVVEPGFAPLVRRCEGVHQVIECNLRQWRKAPWKLATRQAWQRFKDQLQALRYDAVIDLQGLTKSGFVSRLARTAPGGRRFALANRTDGSSHEAPTRWLADTAITVTQHSHAVQRSRELCAKALGYAFEPMAPSPARFGLRQHQGPHDQAVALVHGTSRADKLWDEAHWIALGQHLLDSGLGIVLPHGNPEELKRSQRLADAWQAHPTVRSGRAGVTVLPAMGLDLLVDHLARTAGVIGVDSGLSHIAVALDLPHVQLYNFDTAWRTGPFHASVRQLSVYASPQPSLAQVWQAWNRVWTRAAAGTPDGAHLGPMQQVSVAQQA